MVHRISGGGAGGAIQRERERHQVVHRIGCGGAIQREGGTKWSSELGLEGLFRERETPSGPQNWGGAIQRERDTKWSTELGWVVVASSCFWYLLLVMVAGWLVGYLLTFGDVLDGWLVGVDVV